MPLPQYPKSRFVRSPDDLPPGEHFAILTFSTITIPGDERSRTHPGHGYPEHTVPSIECEVFESREGWESEVKRQAGLPHSSRVWAPVVIRRVALKTTVVVDIG
jgi:hypothetical protein